MNIYEELKDRGFIYQETDAEKTKSLLNNEKITFYVGFDPTADSLHVGHLLPIMGMRLLQKAGHRPLAIIGGATALVGDPSGKQSARPILTKEKVAKNAESLKAQFQKFVSFENDGALLLNNADWFMDMNYIDFLREVGAKFSVNRMLGAESVKQRLESGLSFLEFNYSIMQAYDFYVLNRDYNCKMQFGGQDQWGNIVAGTELTRRMQGSEVTATTFPLLLNSQGEKFGKTAGNAVWLDPKRTSVFDYYQFWRNSDDADVPKLLGFFTNLPLDEIKDLSLLQAPAINHAKEILAFEATTLAHGEAEAAKAYLAAGSKFGFADPENKIPTSSKIATIKCESATVSADLPCTELQTADIPEDGIWIIKLFVAAGLCKSNGNARRLITGGGAYINDERVSDVNTNVTVEAFGTDGIILKAGKKNIKRVKLV